jgi:glycosylphosphatidylinositol transamidase (GPIT) subunit GPI8
MGCWSLRWLLAAQALLFCTLLIRSTGATGAGDTWAVIVGSSRYWLNYRHTSNALGIYQAVRRWELDDREIISLRTTPFF